MISVEAWTTIRYLKAQGLGTRKIAKEIGVARNTVRQAVRSEGPPKYERPPRPNPKLEPLRGVIRRMLTNDHFIGSRILREIHNMGYDGSQMAFYRFLAKIKAVILRLGIQKEELLPTLKINPVHEGKTEIRYGGWNCAVGPNYQTPQAEKFVSDLMAQAMVLPESADMRQQLDQRRKVIEAIREELATIKLRRIVPGRCKYCPI